MARKVGIGQLSSGCSFRTSGDRETTYIFVRLGSSIDPEKGKPRQRILHHTTGEITIAETDQVWLIEDPPEPGKQWKNTGVGPRGGQRGWRGTRPR